MMGSGHSSGQLKPTNRIYGSYVNPALPGHDLTPADWNLRNPHKPKHASSVCDEPGWVTLPQVEDFPDHIRRRWRPGAMTQPFI